ncbi:MAG: hypothetical protein H6658_14855 [Ardenticatenaceae bacterium]|nr:hypothetical protein [Ardenticatenaceae bacterium]
MIIRRIYILMTLAGLTLVFLGAAAYSLWNWQKATERLNESILPAAGIAAADVLTIDTPQALRLTVNETGIATITARQLQLAKLPFNELSAETIRLTRAGKPVPFYVAGEGENAALYFYAQAVTNTLDAPMVYLLSPGQGVAMAQKTAVPQTEGDPTGFFHFVWEEDENFLAEEADGDLWLGPLLLAPRRWNLSLVDVQANGGPAQLSVRLWSSTEDAPDPDHHVEVMVNGRQMASWYWDGIRHQTLSVILPEGELQPDYHNLITINVPGDTGAAGEAFYIDWIYLKYTGHLDAAFTPLEFSSDAQTIRIDNAPNPLLIFDITNHKQPVVLTGYRHEANQINAAGRGEGASYIALNPTEALHPSLSAMPQRETTLQEAGRGADYLVIVADGYGFEEVLQPLLAYRAEQGLQVTAVSLSQIYDEFSYAQQSPTAIRRFLTYAAANWQPAPRFVLLVGDASYDLHNLTNGKNRNLLPTTYVGTRQGHFVASDAWYTADVPQIAIGRFPVQTAVQLHALVQKTIAYETASTADWNQLALLVADDEPKFDLVSDDIATQLHDNGYQTHKLYMTENDNIHYNIISTLNQGVGLVNYMGHGGATMWGDEAVLRTEDAAMLANADRLPIFTTFTCSNGDFAHPQTDSLAESLLWVDGGGVVAAIAPSGRAMIEQQLPLSEMFYAHLLGDGRQTLGGVLTAVRQATSSDPTQADIMQTINLLGDPALRLKRPSP